MSTEHLAEATSSTSLLGLTSKNALSDEERTTIEKNLSNAIEKIRQQSIEISVLKTQVANFVDRSGNKAVEFYQKDHAEIVEASITYLKSASDKTHRDMVEHGNLAAREKTLREENEKLKEKLNINYYVAVDESSRAINAENTFQAAKREVEEAKSEAWLAKEKAWEAEQNATLTIKSAEDMINNVDSADTLVQKRITRLENELAGKTEEAKKYMELTQRLNAEAKRLHIEHEAVMSKAESDRKNYERILNENFAKRSGDKLSSSISASPNETVVEDPSNPSSSELKIKFLSSADLDEAPSDINEVSFDIDETASDIDSSIIEINQFISTKPIYILVLVILAFQISLRYCS